MIAYTWPLSFHLAPESLGRVLIDFAPLKVFGALLWAGALLIYTSALRAFGNSWRLGVDEPGRLVTNGIFSWSRHPIDVSFFLMSFGTFFILGRLIFLLLALASIPLLHHRILREERFLLSNHGDACRDYSSRVPRYGKWL